MRILVPTLLILAAPAAAAPQARAQLKAPLAGHFSQCRVGPSLAQSPPRADRPQKLGELPPGHLYLTVVRTVDGCPIPALSQTRIGR